MDTSRPSTPDAPPQDLWSSILDSVSSTRSIPAKQVLLLGEPSAGKSTIANALLKKQTEDSKEGHKHFALGYDWVDVRDDADEDTIARLSVYTVPSSAQSYLALLPHFLPPRSSLQHSVVVIVLDWTRPWTFIEQLELWFAWVEKWTMGDGSRELEIAREDSRERLLSHLQHYSEPSAEPLPPTSTLGSTVLPLGQGTFTHNTSGVPIVVVCAKADLIDDAAELVGGGTSGMGGMVKGKGSEWEERTDSVMQVLRTICLKYGAALFYTTPQPETLAALRQYTLHLLFVPLSQSSTTHSGGEALVPIRNPFPFTQKPNTLDRDRILVPAGWDSWGKIVVLRDGFDAKAWGEAWERDIENSEDLENRQSQESESGARRLFSALVPDRGPKPTPLPPFNSPTPEQAFLAKHYDENSKKPDRDPRGAFRNPVEGIASTAGIVGPLGSSSFNLPNVERALVEMEGGAVPGSATGADARKGPRRDGTARPTNTLSAAGQSVSPTIPASSRPTGAPSLAPSTSGSGGQSQHEVLHNFFQSLLTSRERGGAASTTSRSPPKEGEDALPGDANGAPSGAG
ncbi:hypothetical protein BD410DRAFT_817695 [Rickenella mellea]|uniref:DLIC-domain-containing protein n=1 Tax=Rickenella mellea TaxID=50990 RepID=A0A4R5XEX7_9AGAM|nr:hypothetical protein BD410DRAFT_817695 [Rickenella mellea]